MALRDLKYSVFGDSSVKHIQANEVELFVRSLTDETTSYSLKALTMKRLTRSIVLISSEIIENSHKFRKLPLAIDHHDLGSSVEIDILIGADTYYDFVLGDIRREDKITAINTVFGWTFVGSQTTGHKLPSLQVNTSLC